MITDGSEERLLAAAEAALPDRTVRDLTELQGDGPAVVGRVTTDDGERYVVKCPPVAAERPGDADASAGARAGDPVSRLRTEAAVMAVVGRETDVPVPEVVRVGVDTADGAEPYLLLRWTEGRTLSEAAGSTPPAAQAAMFRDLGATLAALHDDLTYDRPGDVVATGPDAFEVEPAESWSMLFAGELAGHVEALGGTRFEALAESVWDHAADRLRRLETPDAPALLHGDVGDGNVVFDGTSTAGVLDWELAFVGHPEYDLCRAELRYFWNRWGEPDEMRSALYDGYRSRRALADGFDDRRPLYLATFYLMSLSTYPEWGPRYTDDLNGLASKLADRVRGLLEPAGSTDG